MCDDDDDDDDHGNDTDDNDDDNYDDNPFQPHLRRLANYTKATNELRTTAVLKPPIGRQLALGLSFIDWEQSACGSVV